MKYVFDSGPFSAFKHYPPNIFPKLWYYLDKLVEDGALLSTREVFNEIERGVPVPFVNGWLKDRKERIFKTPSAEEGLFVAEILKIKHFQQLIEKKKSYLPGPSADPFVIACAKVRDAIVVTEEKYKPNAPKIPNVCEHFSIRCIDFAKFMEEQQWKF